MADKPIPTVPGADLPEDWSMNQIVAPDGSDVGLTEQHGYNYLMQKVNAIASALALVNNAFTELIGKDVVGKANGVAGLNSAGLLDTALFPTLDYIKTSARDAASGVAPLDAAKKVPIANLYAAVANGLATLGSDGFVPAGQLNLNAAQVAETTERVWMSPDEQTKLGNVSPITFGSYIGDGTGQTPAVNQTYDYDEWIESRIIELPFEPTVLFVFANGNRSGVAMWQAMYLNVNDFGGAGTHNPRISYLEGNKLYVIGKTYSISDYNTSNTMNVDGKTYSWIAVK